MTTAWPEVALGEVCLITMGQAPSGESYNSEGDGWPLISGAGDFHNGLPKAKKFTSVKTKLCEPGDIVLGIRASIGSKVLADKIYCLGRGVAGLRASVDLEERYLWHWLDAVAEDLAAQGRGATFKQVNKNDVAELKIPLPPLDEQRRIAAILDKADVVRAKRKAALETLETLSLAIFIEMFGDPVSNPMGWPVESLADLVRPGDRINYGVVQPGTFVNGGVPLVRASDINDGFIQETDLKLIAPEIEARYERSRLVGDEILVSCVGSIGAVALVSESHAGFNIARAVARIPLRSDVSREYVAAFIQSPAAQRYFVSELRTVAQPTLNIKQLKELRLPLPPNGQQRAFSKALDELRSIQRRFQFELSEQLELSISLQQKAFQGAL